MIYLHASSTVFNQDATNLLEYINDWSATHDQRHLGTDIIQIYTQGVRFCTTAGLCRKCPGVATAAGYWGS